ncbi:MBL fold metallo-hydrolase [Acuticoccus sp. MNP-M23]|uniref:MBL fold metallo-hydrolase n=1 Tax=Acuticoccus sp. MNP-M23 TaxID=3072793 RepID=UPI0028158298|nr:MBL fold metallo-hydrolase [Acuticoccus sp. MNP-M23]WMS43779.1 MBL fold metallo-hydrolase [Acuticoccus sp. MNP-M23]
MAAPRLNTQVPGWYRFLIGEFECTIIWDGYIHHLYDGLFPNGDPAEVQRLQEAYRLPLDHIPMDLNPALVNTADRLFVVDTGMGQKRPIMGDFTGKMAQNMASAGLHQADVDVVLITHMHPDHTFGLIRPDGSKTYPNADLVVPRIDWEEWTDTRNLGRDDFRGVWTEGILEAVAPYRDRIRLVEPGEQPFAGVSVMSVAGHSSGQCAYIFESNGEKVIFTGDATHHHVFDPHHPEWFFHNEFDSNPAQGAEAKATVFRKAVDERLRFHGYHFPYPGLGIIIPADDGSFRYLPDMPTPRLGPGRFGT